MEFKLISLDNAINKVKGSNLPVLFVDTCSLLDIIRIPFRESSHTNAKNQLLSAQKIVDLASNNKLHVFFSHLISQEWSENYPNTCNELKRHINKLNNDLSILSAIQDYTPFFFNSSDFHSLLKNTSQSLLDFGWHLLEDNEITLKAAKRAAAYTPPARKGAIKDCIIYEHYLYLLIELRKHNIINNIVLLTSNKNDFCENNGTPKEPIKTELINANAKLTLDWSWAITEINKNPLS